MSVEDLGSGVCFEHHVRPPLMSDAQPQSSVQNGVLFTGLIICIVAALTHKDWLPTVSSTIGISTSVTTAHAGEPAIGHSEAGRLK